MAKNPDNPKKPVKTPKSKAHRPDVQPIGPALAELLNPAINRGDAGLGSGTGLRPPPDNSKDRRSGGEAAVHRARASTRGTSDDVAKRDASSSPPSTREARGGVETSEARSGGSGVGGASANPVPEREREIAEPPPTPDLESELRSPRTPPLRGGRGADEAAAVRMKGKPSGNENPRGDRA